MSLSRTNDLNLDQDFKFPYYTDSTITWDDVSELLALALA